MVRTAGATGCPTAWAASSVAGDLVVEVVEVASATWAAAEDGAAAERMAAAELGASVEG